MLTRLNCTRHSLRNRVMVLLSVKAGLRAKEIASLTWSMVTDAEGSVGEAIQLEDRIAKRRSRRSIPLNPQLRSALAELQVARQPVPADTVVYSDRGVSMSAGSGTVWFHVLYKQLGFQGCSSHSGRRTFITRAARKIVEAGGALRDVEDPAGHRSRSSSRAASRVDRCEVPGGNDDLRGGAGRHWTWESSGRWTKKQWWVGSTDPGPLIP
jgi:integrase/recombinase XerC